MKSIIPQVGVYPASQTAHWWSWLSLCIRHCRNVCWSTLGSEGRIWEMRCFQTCSLQWFDCRVFLLRFCSCCRNHEVTLRCTDYKQFWKDVAWLAPPTRGLMSPDILSFDMIWEVNDSNLPYLTSWLIRSIISKLCFCKFRWFFLQLILYNVNICHYVYTTWSINFVEKMVQLRSSTHHRESTPIRTAGLFQPGGHRAPLLRLHLPRAAGTEMDGVVGGELGPGAQMAGADLPWLMDTYG